MIFVDSSALVGRFMANDGHHVQSKALWRKLEAERATCLTTNFVLAESLTLLGRRAGYDFAAQRARALYASVWVTILRPAEEDERQALEFFEKYADQKIGFTDCVSFAIMRRMKIAKVFTFDRHFEFAGFQKLP